MLRRNWNSMLNFIFTIFFLGFPGIQILVAVFSIFLALKRNKLNKRMYGLFFPIILTMCNIWLISIDRTEIYDDVLRFYFFLISFCFPMLIIAVIYHAFRLSSVNSLLRWKVIVISFCYLIGLVFHLVNTMYWNEVLQGHQNVFNAFLIGTAVISFLPAIYLFFVQRKIKQASTS